MRGALAFGIPMLVFAVWVAVAVDDVPEIRIFLPLMCVLGFVLYLLFAVRPLADDMARFAQWGDRKEGLDRFCWEYFLEEPVLKTKAVGCRILKRAGCASFLFWTEDAVPSAEMMGERIKFSDMQSNTGKCICSPFRVWQSIGRYSL